MSSIEDTLSDEIEVALAYTPAGMRPCVETAFGLDHRLSRIVSATTEPMLGQMRLAWWRDMLATPSPQRPTGDAVLDAVGAHWQDKEAALSEMVDGWEILIVSDGLSQAELLTFAQKRAAPFAALIPDDNMQSRQRVQTAAQRWALADTASKISSDEERSIVLRAVDAIPAAMGMIPKVLRGLAVLEALALRGLAAGGRPLMEGRGASLTALRAGIFGR